MFHPEKREKTLGIAIPASFTLDLHPREKTVKAGLVARAAAIFRVNDIIIYIDKYGVEGEGEWLSTILKYCETPQYLRKQIYKISTFLRYAGLLPPLKIPSHTVSTSVDEIRNYEFREGVVVKSGDKVSLVDIGFEKLYPIPKRLNKGERITVKLIRQDDGSLKLSLSSKDEVDKYWGYNVHYNYENIIDCVRRYNADLVIATSKYGVPIHSVLNDLINALSNSKKILILFGSPQEGLFEICKRFKVDLSNISHFIVNTIPSQGCETIRTEESIFSTLSILNLLLCLQVHKR